MYKLLPVFVCVLLFLNVSDRGEGAIKTDDPSKPDDDRDSITNKEDNCPTIANNQADTDKDGIGDVCDSTNNLDTDKDGIIDSVDNCPKISNINQLDANNNNIGDACDNNDVNTRCALTQKISTRTDSGLYVVHHDGQSFISWQDRAKGEAGANFRYRLYRSTTPIKMDNDLNNAELIADRIVNHSGQLFGHAFFPKNRLDPKRPMATIIEGGKPLPLWSGLWVANARKNACAFYAILATDLVDNPIESIVAGINATTEPVAELVTPHKPILLYRSDQRDGPSIAQTRVTGTSNLPLSVHLHASQGRGGGAGSYGDYYLYFGNRSMGYQEGMPGVFSIQETHSGPQKLLMRNRDTIVAPEGNWLPTMETSWFGYVAEPLYSGKRFAYPFTENRLLWTISWVIKKYNVDPMRIYVSGGSMGAWGAMTFAFRHPELFAAIYPDRPRMRQKNMSSTVSKVRDNDTLPNGENWRDHHDSVRFAANHSDDLPFLGWNIGRRDGFATWQEQVDMVLALTSNRHGFAFAWNNGDHGDLKTQKVIQRWYPESKFAKNESYPAFSNSSIDDNLGNGDPADGDLKGGINLGFDWKVKSDTKSEWVVEISNKLAKGKMSVDVTPRRRQHFKPAPNSNISYEIHQGKTILRSGTVTVDTNGLITIIEVELFPSKVTTIRLISKSH